MSPLDLRWPRGRPSDAELAGVRAAVDQVGAAREAVDEVLPFNAGLRRDERVEAAMLDALGQPDRERLTGRLAGHDVTELGPASDAAILWPSVAVPLAPDELTVAGIERAARETAPHLALASCERCTRTPCTSAALVAVPPKVIALTFCAGCSAYLATSCGPVRWLLPHDPTQED